MECRCYRGGDGRTRMTKLTFTFDDAMLLLLIAIMGAAVILINTFVPGLSL
jgi:energy-coupling factor transport system permease protein